MRTIKSAIIFLLLTTCIFSQEKIEPKVAQFNSADYPKETFQITFDSLKFHNLLIDIIRIRSLKGDYRVNCRSWLTVKNNNRIIYQRYFPSIDAVGACYGIFIPIIQPRKDYLLVTKLGDYDSKVFIIDSLGKVTEKNGRGLYISNDKRYLFSHSAAEDWLTVYDFEQGSSLFSEKLRPSLGDWYLQDNKYISPIVHNMKGDQSGTYVIFDLTLNKLIISAVNDILPDPKSKLQNYLEIANLIDCNCGLERIRRR